MCLPWEEGEPFCFQFQAGETGSNLIVCEPFDTGTATGLGSLGKVRLLEKPHTGSNYLMQEMGFQIARKHAAQLRKICFVTGILIPILLIGLMVMGLTAGGYAILTLAAAISAGVGVVFERWLFFAEAKHTVMLYYGATDA